MSRRWVLLSLHDVAPVHRERIERAEALFAELGVEQVTYLLIPDYHRQGRSDTADFAAWCRRARPFAVDWFLHGYYHLETEDAVGAHDGAPLRDGGFRAALTRRYATAGEGEFLALDAAEARERVARGAGVFERCLGEPPRGFVPPAWLYDASLPPVLREHGIRYFEDHRRVYDLDAGTALDAPVVTWATRTPLRKWTSILGTPALRWAWRNRPVLRLAVHPFDFDHPETVASIRRVWGAALAGRSQARYDEVAGDLIG